VDCRERKVGRGGGGWLRRRRGSFGKVRKAGKEGLVVAINDNNNDDEDDAEEDKDSDDDGDDGVG
jgi:hypothetical protein